MWSVLMSAPKVSLMYGFIWAGLAFLPKWASASRTMSILVGLVRRPFFGPGVPEPLVLSAIGPSLRDGCGRLYR